MRHTGRRATVIVALLAMLATRAAAGQTTDPALAWRQMATTIPSGSEVRLHLKNGQRFVAVLLRADDLTVLMQPKTRLPVPPQTVAYTDLLSVQVRTPGDMNAAKVIGIGVAAGGAAFLGFLLMIIAASD